MAFIMLETNLLGAGDRRVSCWKPRWKRGFHATSLQPHMHTAIVTSDFQKLRPYGEMIAILTGTHFRKRGVSCSNTHLRVRYTHKLQIAKGLIWSTLCMLKHMRSVVHVQWSVWSAHNYCERSQRSGPTRTPTALKTVLSSQLDSRNSHAALNK